MAETSIPQRLATVRVWRTVALVAVFLVLAFLCFAVGLYAHRVQRTVKERAVIRAAKAEGETLAGVLTGELGPSGTEVQDAASRGVFGPKVARYLEEHTGVSCLHLVGPGGEIVWSSERAAAGKPWDGGVPRKFLAANRRRIRFLDPENQDPDIYVEVVTPVETPDGTAALVMGLSDVRISEQVRRDYWLTLALLGGVGAALSGAVLFGHQVLTRRGLQLARLGEREEQLGHLGLLAGGLAHEIRNPLNAMRFALRSLRARAEKSASGDLGQEMAEIVDELSREVDGLERLVTSFLSYARPAKGSPEQCEINEVCRSALTIALPELEKHGAKVSLELPDPPVCTVTFPARLRQILVNLLHNAAQADGSREVVLRAVREGKTVRIMVEDDGAGVPEEVRGHLFEPFQTGRRDGTGLGLAVCRRLAAEMEGTVSYEPSKLNGSIFAVEIPLKNAP